MFNKVDPELPYRPSFRAMRYFGMDTWPFPVVTAATKVKKQEEDVDPTKAKKMGKTEEFKLETAPFDPRFPNQNQTRYCWQSYVDYHRCRRIKGEDYQPCEYFHKVYKSICPFAWVDKWDDQRENGTFPAKI